MKCRRARTYFQVVRKYSPTQPRVPAGNSAGGQFTSGGAAGGVAASSSGGLVAFRTVTDSKEFISAMNAAKATNPPEGRWRVYVHDEGDYDGDRKFMTDGGSCIAIEPSGNIVSVCKNLDEPRPPYGSDLLKKAVAEGGDRLDAFGEGLYKFYTKNGFEPVSHCKFVEKFAPDDWVKGRDAKEPIVFYKHTGAKVTESYQDFLNRVKPSKNYDAAAAARDKEMK